MNEIKLSVDDKNLEVVMTVLENLKEGLIEDIQTNGTQTTKHTQYKPKTNVVIKEEDSGTHDRSGKYASASVYKERLKTKRNN